MLVFSKKVFLSLDNNLAVYELSKTALSSQYPSWVDICDGLTEFEMGRLGYRTLPEWMIDKNPKTIDIYKEKQHNADT